ncbi:MAG: hypothetical protein MRY83_16170 [Flavobacteriales bacterium]|nr:hypothetical protein [Flavobacteriales bacterium]
MNLVRSIVLIVLMLVGVLTFILTATDTYPSMVECLKQFMAVDAFLYVTYIFAGLAAVLAVAASASGILSNPKGGRGSYILLGGLVLVYAISYGLAGAEPYKELTGDEVKSVETRLIVLYIVFGLAVLSILFSGVKKLIR